MEHNASMTAKVMEVGEVLTIQFERDPVPIHLQPGSYKIERIADPEPEKKPGVKSLGEIACIGFYKDDGRIWNQTQPNSRNQWQAAAEAVVEASVHPTHKACRELAASNRELREKLEETNQLAERFRMEAVQSNEKIREQRLTINRLTERLTNITIQARNILEESDV